VISVSIRTYPSYSLSQSRHISSEDYQGPTSSGLFKWVPDENGQLRPVTRMKGQNLERNPAYWDKVYNKKKEESDDN
jgi:hypothetical protein